MHENKSNRKDDDLTGVQGWIIGFIYTSNSKPKDVFQRDIENEFHIRRSTATGILKLLEKNEYIKRIPVSYDKRLKKIILTEKAKLIHEDMVKRIEKFDEELEKGISEFELEMFFKVVDKVKKNIE